MDNRDFTDETFTLTTQILQWNPDFYTIWNYRRIVLIEHILKDLNEEEKQKVYNKELMLFLQLIKINPKSYWLWNHRFWCLQHMPTPNWKAELGLVDKMLTFDARNFHGWNYRRYVVNHLRKNSDHVAEIIQGEYDFTTKKINQSFSNYSAWHQRSKLLPEIVATMSSEEKNEVVINELDLVKNAIYTDPEDQSAWLYYWWLLGRSPEEVSPSGAYQIEQDTSLVIFGFNDKIRFMQPPQLLDHNGKLIQSTLYSLVGENSSIWAMWIKSEKKDIAKELIIHSNSILPSSSSKSIPLDKIWRVEIKRLERGPVVYEKIQSLKKQVLNSENEWKELTTKLYKDPTLNDQTAWYTLDKVQLLKDEIETVRELLELEPNSAWALQTLVHFLHQLQLRSNQVDPIKIYDEIISILDDLIKIDSDRKMRYKDKSKILKRRMRQVWHTKMIYV
ncbi:uncharacterized protein BX663DRAFT_485656 [Cokeromyces recurvatus]|uniref:uncharacterized protein n=1 Tax=Cokeromyces recurvatus TaxID=90255 RepID=UPI00221F4CB5|nr:uncharacterized protein BX663DRAFT_485656 [Cokeromyces recurvatus]KAI7903509.1 hypothetical protein BX663DRAFT_485656 [Cokeromyces recurvatus]